MKSNLIAPVITLCAVLAAVSGCSKQETPPPAAETSKPAEAVAPAATKAVDASTPAATQVPDQAAAQATAQVSAGEQQAQSLIDQAKAYLTSQKYQDALGSVNQLTNTKLTPDQQKLVDDLKAQIQSALAKASTPDAASVLGNALGGKK